MEDKFKVGDIVYHYSDSFDTKGFYIVTQTPCQTQRENTYWVKNQRGHNDECGKYYFECFSKKHDVQLFEPKDKTVVKYKSGKVGIILDNYIYDDKFKIIEPCINAMCNIFISGQHYGSGDYIIATHTPVLVHTFLYGNLEFEENSVWVYDKPHKITMKQVCEKFGYEVEIVEE